MDIIGSANFVTTIYAFHIRMVRLHCTFAGQYSLIETALSAQSRRLGTSRNRRAKHDSQQVSMPWLCGNAHVSVLGEGVDLIDTSNLVYWKDDSMRACDNKIYKDVKNVRKSVRGRGSKKVIEWKGRKQQCGGVWEEVWGLLGLFGVIWVIR